ATASWRNRYATGPKGRQQTAGLLGGRPLHLAGRRLLEVLGENGRLGGPAQPGLFRVVLHVLLEGADEILADELVILLAHHRFVAEEVLVLQALESKRDLHRVDGARLGRGLLQILEDGAEARGVEVEWILFAELLGPGFGFLVADLRRNVL